jgi:hypothetical protein
VHNQDLIGAFFKSFLGITYFRPINKNEEFGHSHYGTLAALLKVTLHLKPCFEFLNLESGQYYYCTDF